MSKLVQAISDAVQAGQNQDWAKLGTSIVGIVENGVGILVNYSILSFHI